MREGGREGRGGVNKHCTCLTLTIQFQVGWCIDKFQIIIIRVFSVLGQGICGERMQASVYIEKDISTTLVRFPHAL